MKSVGLPFLAGALFALGLAIGGMTQPAKVVAFLDFFGNWDPSLAFVMAGAILAYFPLYRKIVGRRAPLFAPDHLIPTRRDLDARLLLGSALFGIGWGLGGYCPGPAFASVGAFASNTLIFVGAMVLGMGVFTLLFERASFRAKTAQRSD